MLPGPEALMDRMERVLSDAAHLPLSNKVLVDQGQLFALLDELRANLPRQVEEARLLLRQREEILQQARLEAEQLLAEARERATGLAQEHELVQLAQQKSQEVLEQARRAAAEIKEGAYVYAADLLARLERYLVQALQAVRDGQKELGMGAGTQGQQPSPAGAEVEAAAGRESRDSRPVR